ncbi:IS3 family transposase [Peribacillus muralis]
MNYHQHVTKVKLSRQRCRMENFFRLLKSKLLYYSYRLKQFIQKLETYIHYFKHERIKVKIKGTSPLVTGFMPSRLPNKIKCLTFWGHFMPGAFFSLL